MARETGRGPTARVRRRVARLLAAVRERLVRVERELWLLAVAGLVGDFALTVYGLERGFTEANPVARAAVNAYGYAALAALKAGALAVGVAGWLVLSRRHRVVVPLALALPWTFAVLANAATLALLS